MSVTYRASINNLPDKSRSSAGRTVHEGHGNRNGTDEVIRTDNGSIQSHLLCPVLLLLFITEIILLLTLLYSSLLYWFPFGFRALPEGVSELLVSQIKSYFSPLFFASFFLRILFGFILQNNVGIDHPVRTSKLRKKNEITEKFGVAEKEFRHVMNLMSGLFEHVSKVRHHHEMIRIG